MCVGVVIATHVCVGVIMATHVCVCVWISDPAGSEGPFRVTLDPTHHRPGTHLDPQVCTNMLWSVRDIEVGREREAVMVTLGPSVVGGGQSREEERKGCYRD